MKKSRLGWHTNRAFLYRRGCFIHISIRVLERLYKKGLVEFHGNASALSRPYDNVLPRWPYKDFFFMRLTDKGRRTGLAKVLE